MKKYELPDMETIERYWGSMEAYQEEQRRNALLGLENTSTDQKSNWNWDFSRSNSKEKSIKPRRKGLLDSFSR